MIHNYGSADVDEEANPLREAIEEVSLTIIIMFFTRLI